MRILFLTSNPDDNVASYRMWVKDLSRSLIEIGHECKVFSTNQSIDSIEYDIVILGKSCYGNASQVKSVFKKSKIGAINIPRDYYNSDIDFVIVGSPEEYISMSKYKNVFVYPLIERKFEEVKIKHHKKRDVTRFCFHGNWPHLAKFLPSISNAIDKYHEEIQNAELHLIIGEDSCPAHNESIPKKSRVLYHNYKKIDFTDIVSKMDIGLVPNVSSLERFFPGISSIENSVMGLYKTDFNIRFKNKTNAGRAYVFYQHGIPVIHDLSPSSFDFMGRTGDYICGHDTDSYFREMVRLTDPGFRNTIAKINIDVFRRDFCPIEHGKKLIEFIEGEVLNE